MIAKPFGWLLLKLYEFCGSYGIAVILFALIVKVILLPFQMKSKRSTMQTSRLQPRLKELEKKHGANKQKYNEEVQKLYREEKINPMSGCIWTLIPFPILIALYQAIRQPLTVMMGVAKELVQEGGAIYDLLTKTGFATNVKSAYLEIAQAEWISRPEFFEQFSELSDKLVQIDYQFLGMDLGQLPQWNFLWKTDWSDVSVWGPGLLLFLIPIISGLASYLSSKISMKASGNTEQQQSMGAMFIMMPLFSVYIGFIMPAALGIYWFISTVLSIIQDVILTKHYKKKMDIEDADRIARENEKAAILEEKRRETERRKAENTTERNPNTSKRKQQINEREEQKAKAAEWERLHNPKKDDEEAGPSQVGKRRYARGRAYDPTRFDANAEIPTESEIPELEVEDVAEVAEEIVEDTIVEVEEIVETIDDGAEEEEAYEDEEFEAEPDEEE